MCEGPLNIAKLNKSDSMLMLHGFPKLVQIMKTTLMTTGGWGLRGGDTTIEGVRQRCLVGGGVSAKVSDLQ